MSENKRMTIEIPADVMAEVATEARKLERFSGRYTPQTKRSGPSQCQWRHPPGSFDSSSRSFSKGRSMMILPWIAPPDKKGFYTMEILNKLQADELFRREAILIGRDDVLPVSKGPGSSQDFREP